MASSLPEDLQSLEELTQPLLDENDDFGAILSQLPPVENFEQYLSAPTALPTAGKVSIPPPTTLPTAGKVAIPLPTPLSTAVKVSIPPPTTLLTAGTERFRSPVTEQEVKAVQKAAVPQNTQKSTNWALSVWKEWSQSRWSRFPTQPLQCPGHLYILCYAPAQLDYWLSRFVLEARRKDGKMYPPNTLHQLVCGILRYARELKPDLDFFKDREFAGFRLTLDAEMKNLRAQGLGTSPKQAEPITETEQECLWAKNVLGDQTPKSLLDTMVFMCGLFFALRSGQEHRTLRLEQIRLVEPPDGKPAYLVYTENVSKNNPGGLKHRKLNPKVVTHHANTECPERCFVRLFKCYISHRPKENVKDNAFYLTPIKNPKSNVWYTCIPCGHNTLSATVRRLCSQAGISGFKTNHSLRVTAATRLFQNGVDEQLIMARTGHRSTDGIRAYKRISEEQQKAVSEILNNSNGNNNCKMEPFELPHLPKVARVDSVDSTDNKENMARGMQNLPVMNFSGCSGNISIHFGSQ